jgi:hypothetical protein
MTRSIRLPGFTLKNGKLEKVPSYRLNVSAKIRQRKSKRVRVTRRAPG